MNKALVAVAIVIILTAAVFTARAEDPEKWKRALAEELLTQLNIRENNEKVLDLIKHTLSSQMVPPEGRTEGQRLLADQLNKVLDVASDEFSWENMREDYVKLYAGLFTEDELKELMSFYGTPVGKAYVRKQPELTRQALEIAQKKIADMIPRIAKMGPSAHEKTDPGMPKRRFMKTEFR